MPEYLYKKKRKKSVTALLPLSHFPASGAYLFFYLDPHAGTHTMHHAVEDPISSHPPSRVHASI